jgi:hypothetical protein
LYQKRFKVSLLIKQSFNGKFKKEQAFFNKRERELYQWIEERNEFQRVSGRYRAMAVNERRRDEDSEERIERDVAEERDIYRDREVMHNINKYTGGKKKRKRINTAIPVRSPVFFIVSLTWL